MYFWIPYALVRVVIFFGFGILLGIYFPDLINLTVAQSALFIGVSVYLIVGLLIRKKVTQFNIGFIGLGCLTLIGYVHVLQKTQITNPDHFSAKLSTIEYYQVVVSSEPEEKAKSLKAECKVQAVYSNGNWVPSMGKVLIYFSKEGFEKQVQFDELFIIAGKPSMVSGPENPGEFDYKRFLSFKNIFHQQFVREADVIARRAVESKSFMRYAIDCRQWAKGVFEQYIGDEKSRAVALALVLGIKDGLDNDLIKAYSSSGAMHVLAVSGLHVGILYWILLMLLKPITKVKYGAWFLAVISIVILWSYAFVTGLSPSVLRAVTMFTFVALARPINYSTNIYNTLAASAFCLLLYDPYLIMSVGFQLSYLAVIGILYLQPRIYYWWNPKFYIVDKVWQITSVSIAAQIATFILGLLYFHQFPVYFLVSNLFVIPGAFIVFCGGVLLLAISFVDQLVVVVGNILEFIISIINKGVYYVESLPFSLVQDVYITTFQCWLLIGFVVFAILLFEQRKFSYLLVASLCGILFSINQWVHHRDFRSQESITVYKVPGSSAIDFFAGNSSYFLADSVLESDIERIKFHIRPNRLLAGIKNVKHCSSGLKFFKIGGGQIIFFKEKTFLIVENSDFTSHPDMVFDFVIISKNAIHDYRKIASIKTNQIIFDSSNSIYHITKLVNQARSEHKIFSVPHSGAFTLKL